MIDTHQTVEELERELVTLPRKIERAAAEEDFVTWSELSMRRDALPRLIRDARAAPLRDELERVDAELDALDEEMDGAKNEPYPEVPSHLRGGVTPAMRHQQRLGNIAQRQTSAGQERREIVRQIVEIENDVT